MSLKLALFKIPWQAVSAYFNQFSVQTFTCKSLNELKCQLREQDIDMVIVEKGQLSESHLAELYENYQVPFYIQDDHEDNNHLGCLRGLKKSVSPLLPISIESHRLKRKARDLENVIKWLKRFEVRVPYSLPELFMESVKNFFQEEFNLQDSYWISVSRRSQNFSSLNSLRELVENNEKNCEKLMKELEQDASQLCKGENWQIWRHTHGSYLCLLWLEAGPEFSGCLALQQLEFNRITEIKNFLSHFTTVLNKRWWLCQKMEESEQKVNRDSLTDLYNQRYLQETLDKKIEENKRYKTPFSVLFIDIDHFKRVNDSLGHVIGSAILVKLANLLLAQIRNSDYAFRYGGDEFILLLSHTTGEPAQRVAERIRERVEKNKFIVEGIEVSITVSIGLAFFPDHANCSKEIIRIADEAMYYGKHKSRNVVYKAS